VISGLRLSRAFYDDVVSRLLADVPHAAALMGPGSEVLGYDDARSTDHDWGPRLIVLLGDERSDDEVDALDVRLDRRLPAEFRSRPIRFALAHDSAVRHRVRVARRVDWFREQVGFDPLSPISTTDWISVPAWRLGEVTAGAVFHDADGTLTRSRTALSWYPVDTWRWVLAAQWQRIAQEEAFPGRCAEIGDLLGSDVLVARIARDLMRLWLLMARTYPPYAKWLGTAFARVPGALGVLADLRTALAAPDWRTRERHLGAALVATGHRQNELGLADPVVATLRPYFDRPYEVIGAGRFAAALLDTIADDELRGLPCVGVVDQFVDSTDALGDARLRTAFAGALRSPGTS
jgi:hypothetical protein